MAEEQKPRTTPLVLSMNEHVVSFDTLPVAPWSEKPIGANATGPIEIQGTWDDSPLPLQLPPASKLTIAMSRKFLWWEVCFERSSGIVVGDKYSESVDAYGLKSVMVDYRTHGVFTVTRAAWWERTLYRVAGLWSR